MSGTVTLKQAVSIHYTLKNTVGDILDSSIGDEPLVYLHGAGNIVEGLEDELDGKSVGDKLSVVVPPAKGYGDKEGPGPQPVPRSAFGDDEVEAGMSLMVEDEDGNHIPLWVVAVQEEHVMVDTNHPLAGETLHFDVEVIEIRDATEQELAHGHAHDDGDDDDDDNDHDDGDDN